MRFQRKSDVLRREIEVCAAGFLLSCVRCRQKKNVPINVQKCWCVKNTPLTVNVMCVFCLKFYNNFPFLIPTFYSLSLSLSPCSDFRSVRARIVIICVATAAMGALAKERKETTACKSF